MDDQEASEASPAPDASPASEPDLQAIISRWAGESRRLLLALPTVLARLAELKDERDALRNRLMDLEQENLTLRESRAELAETFAKLKDLVAGTALDETQRNIELAMAEPAAERAQPPATAPEPPVTESEPPAPEPVGQAALDSPKPDSSTPESRPEPVQQAAPEPPAPSPAPARYVGPEPPRPAAPEPSSPTPEPAHSAAPESKPPAKPEPVSEKPSEPPPPPSSDPAPPKGDKVPLRRVEPSPVRLASVFRPPASKK